MNKLIHCFFFILLAPCLLFAQETIRIGAILPLTGDMAAVGPAGRDAIQMALSDNSQQSKRKFEVIFEDDRLTPNEVAKAAQKLISVDKVSAIISIWSYGGTIVAPMAERAKIPHIGIAWDHHVADGEYSFLHLTPPSEFMRLFLTAFKKIGVHKVALLGIEESGSVFALDEFVRMSKDYGLEVVFRESVLWDINDLNSVVTKIARVKPDYLVFNLGGQGLISKLLESLQNQKVKFKYSAITSFDVLEDTSAIEGYWYVSDSFLPENFSNRFQKLYGHSIRYGVGNLYEALRLLMYGFNNSKNGLPEEAKNALKQINNLPSIFGPTSVSSEGIFTYPAQYVRIENKKRILTELSKISE